MKPDKQVKSRKPNGQFAAGVSGNPAGRPKKRTLSEDLRDRLKEQYPGRTDTTYQRMVAEALVDMAIDKDISAVKECFDRTEGKVSQSLNLVVEEKKREIYDAGMQALKQTGMTDEEAAQFLAAFVPEADWIN